MVGTVLCPAFFAAASSECGVSRKHFASDPEPGQAVCESTREQQQKRARDAATEQQLKGKSPAFWCYDVVHTFVDDVVETHMLRVEKKAEAKAQPKKGHEKQAYH